MWHISMWVHFLLGSLCLYVVHLCVSVCVCLQGCLFVCLCGEKEREIYFKESAHMIMEAGKSSAE